MMVHVECDNDTHMFKLFKHKKTDLSIDHVGGKPRVIRKIRENRSGIGIIDKDNQNLNAELQGSVLLDHKYGISVYRYHNAIIIEFEKDLEHWLFTVAKNNNVNPKDYKVPSNNYPTKIVKKMYKKKGYSQFISALLPSKEFQFFLSQIR